MILHHANYKLDLMTKDEVVFSIMVNASDKQKRELVKVGLDDSGQARRS